MTRARLVLPVLAIAALVAACSDESPPPSPPTASEQAPAAAPPTAGQQAVDKLKEAADLAAKAAREEADRLAARAQDALKDAQPSLDKAREALNQFAGQASENLEKAARDLETRLREATGAPQILPSPTGAALPPADRLRADTRAAASPRAAGVVPDYVGVWASDAAACARIDQTPQPDRFAVITPSTIRSEGSVCNIAAPAAGSAASLQASCQSDSGTETRQITLDMPSPDTLRLGSPSEAAMTRCHLPG